MGMKIASLQLKKRANALIVFRFREKPCGRILRDYKEKMTHTLLSLRPQWKCRAFWERVGPRTPWVKSVENFKKKKTEYCQMLKSSKGHKFRAKLGSVRFHYLKAVVCMYARSTKKKFQVPFGLKKSLWMGSYFYSEVKRHCLFLRAQSLVFNLNARKLLSSLN